MARAKHRIKRVKKDTAFPTPAILPGIRGGADWHVKDGGELSGATINYLGGSASMAIPLGDDADSKYIRLHELLHAAHSPLEAPRDIVKEDGTVVTKQALMMAEEVRVDSIARTMAGKNSLPPFHADAVKSHIETLAPLYAKTGKTEIGNELISMAVAGWAQGPEHMGRSPLFVAELRSHIFNGGYDEKERERLHGIANLIEGGLDRMFSSVWEEEFEELFEHQTFPDWSSVIDLAEFIDTMYEAVDEIDTPTPEVKGDPDVQVLVQKANQKGDNPITKMMDKLDKGLEKQGFKPPIPEMFTNNEVIWGEMKVRRPKRPLRLPKTKSSRSKYSATDAGASPRYIHRLLTDGQVFARKKRIPGGSVLIDDSGSMSWSNEEIALIVESAPAIDIAAYSGTGQPGGELMIVSEDGTWTDVTKNRPEGSGNVVDMPALEWLATKKEPRIWVSDQLVVPLSGDRKQASIDVLAFIQANNINVVETATEAARVFAGKKAVYR